MIGPLYQHLTPTERTNLIEQTLRETGTTLDNLDRQHRRGWWDTETEQHAWITLEGLGAYKTLG